MQLKKSGFTLIELLVVISIISLLASVVLSSLNSARAGARSAAIKSEALELFKLANLAYFDLGNFNLFSNAGWVSNQADCINSFDSTTYQSQAVAICESIMSKLSDVNSTSGLLLHCSDADGAGTTSVCNNATDYSVQVHLVNDNGSTDWFCVGTSGAKYEGNRNYYADGCYYNP